MYCGNCGTFNPDGQKFCPGCGNRLVHEPPKPAGIAAAYEEKFRMQWREFVKSPLVLIAIIVYSMVVLYSLVSQDSQLLLESSVIDGFYLILMDMPGILICVGLWMTYAEAAKGTTEPIKTTGLSIIHTTMIVNVVLFLFAAVVLTVSACEILESTEKVSDSASNVVDGFVMGLLIAFCAVVAYFVAILRIIDNARKIAVSCYPDPSMTVFAMVILLFCGFFLLFIGGLTEGFMSALDSMDAFSEIDFSAGSIIVSGVEFVLFGIVIVKYRERLLAMQQEYIKSKEQEHRALRTQDVGSAAPRTTAGYQDIPTWKRIEMEREQGQNTN